MNYVLKQPFYCSYGYNITIGLNFYSDVNLTILDQGGVSIGDNVILGPNVNIYTASHPYNEVQRIKGLEYAKPVKIYDNVWIGGNVTILPGVKINQGAIIGAGSVVTHDIPPYVIAVGNPCEVVRSSTKRMFIKLVRKSISICEMLFYLIFFTFEKLINSMLLSSMNFLISGDKINSNSFILGKQ